MDGTDQEPEQNEGAARRPAWYGNGAIHIVLKSLFEVDETLERLVKEARNLDEQLRPLGLKYPSDMLAVQERFNWDFHRLYDELEVELRHSTDTAILMAAIELESDVNGLLYRDIGEAVGEAAESLSLLNKLEVAHRILGKPRFKGTAQYEAVHQLVKWRNAFAHGRTPNASVHPRLREDVAPGDHSKGDHEWRVAQLSRYMRYYATAEKHILSISPERTGAVSVEVYFIEQCMRFIGLYEYRDGFAVSRREIPDDLRENINPEWRRRLIALDSTDL